MLVAASSVVSVVAVGASAARTALPRCSAHAPFTRAQLSTASKSVLNLFPSAASLGFVYRNDHGPQPRRHPYWPGWCGRWWVEYTDRAPSGRHGYVRGDVDVVITIFRSAAQAVAALQEPAYGSPKVLANGATVRVAPDGGGIESVIRNVAIGTFSSYPYANGVPDHTRLPVFGESVQMTIQRRIQGAVLELR